MGNIFTNCLEDYSEYKIKKSCAYCKLKSSHYEIKCNNCDSVFHKQCFSNKINKCPVCNATGSIMIWEYILK